VIDKQLGSVTPHPRHLGVTIVSQNSVPADAEFVVSLSGAVFGSSATGNGCFIKTIKNIGKEGREGSGRTRRRWCSNHGIIGTGMGVIEQVSISIMKQMGVLQINLIDG
jgi:hypothetical protein